MQLYPTKNKGQERQKYIENNHPAIISRETFAAAQSELERRSSLRSSGTTGRGRYSGKFPFSNLIICGCGYKFRRHAYIYHRIKSPKIDPVWTCYKHIKKGGCGQLPIKEKRLEELFLAALNDLLKDRKILLDQIEEIIIESVNENGGFDSRCAADIDAEIERLQAEVMALTQKRIKRELSQEEFAALSEPKTARIEELFDERDEVSAVSGTAALEKAKLGAIKQFLQTEREQTAFEKNLPQRLLENIIIRSREDITFEFKNGLQIKAKTDMSPPEVTVPKNLDEAIATPRAKFVK